MRPSLEARIDLALVDPEKKDNTNANAPFAENAEFD